MKDKNYYDKYWNKNINGGMLYLPPQWTEENLLWHLEFFKNYIGKTVLDVGAGDGTFLNFLASKTTIIKKAVASELSIKALEIGKNKYKNLIFEQEDLESLSFQDNSFDTVFAIEVIEHLLDIDRCLSEINRVLKKNGFFCITTTDFNLLKKIIIATFFWDKFFYPNNPHIRFLTKKTLINICKKHNFELVNYKWNKGYLGIMPKGQMIVFRKKCF